MTSIRIVGTAAPLMQANINTDRIMPGEWMMRGQSEGLAVGLFGDDRYLPDGKDNPDFILNRRPWNSASILLAGSNFGCGSTREEAPLALRSFGFRCLIAPSFPAVFFANCFRNGILAIELPPERVAEFAVMAEESEGQAVFTVDLDQQVITPPAGDVVNFQSPPKLRQMLLEGTDEIGLTLGLKPQIETFRQSDRERRPWAYFG